MRQVIGGTYLAGATGTLTQLRSGGKVTVTDGVVTLAGELGQKSMIPIAIRMTQTVDGVVDVENRLSFAVHDTHPQGYVDTSRY